MTLGERVKAVRQNSGLSHPVIATKSVSRADSLKQLADAAGLDIRNIQRCESGEFDVANMILPVALKIADALGVDAKNFYKFELRGVIQQPPVWAAVFISLRALKRFDYKRAG